MRIDARAPSASRHALPYGSEWSKKSILIVKSDLNHCTPFILYNLPKFAFSEKAGRDIFCLVTSHVSQIIQGISHHGFLNSWQKTNRMQ